MMQTWNDGTPKSTNNAFTPVTPARKKSASNKNRLKLTKHEQAICSVMEPLEVKAFRLKIKQRGEASCKSASQA
jgi:hypothetical protein